MAGYDHKEIEQKWQKYWNKHPDLFAADEKSEKEKKYILDMFPYPSGDGLHVGHVESYTATDIMSRYFRLQGKNVLHPQGWDAFGLPAENYAIKTKIHPTETTKKAIETFKKQMNRMGFSYDWSREINSSDPEYYKWTQWLFLQLYKNKLAYKAKAKVNWCESCQTVLANEQAEGGVCERCGSKVIQKDLEQWFFKITDFIEDSGKTSGLLSGLDKLDWPKSTKQAQRNWIGRSEGTTIKFKVQSSKFKVTDKEENYLEVFTTRVDTIFGCTYCVVAPEHKIIQNLKSQITNYAEVEKYIAESKKKTDLMRMEAKEKTGVEIKGIKITNPFNDEELPLFVADYVLAQYGTGAVMAVPAHDERDFEFAKKYKLPIIQVIKKDKITPRSYLMGAEQISDQELVDVGVKIIGKTKSGSRKLEVPQKEIKKYAELIKSKMTKGFWNEIVGDEILFIFKSKNGEIKEFILDKNNSKEIEKMAAEYNDAPYLGQTSTWKWIAENDFYTDLIIHTEDGELINSEKYSGLSSEKAREEMTKWLSENKLGGQKINYKLRDWLVSRQRYWGAPIPIIYCEKCGKVAVPEEDLPVILPTDVDFKPTGESPLVNSKIFHNVKCPKCGGKAQRESDTMDTFVCSSWYYFRYADPKNEKAFASKEQIKKWLPVDLYVGGAEHTVLHLLYARFFTKVLHKLGHIDFAEPFLKLRHQGIILAEDGNKMSKSKGNVVNPDEVVEKFGADALRMFEMFMGPLEDMKPWNTKGIVGLERFLEKVYKNSEKISEENFIDKKTENLLHKTIKKVTEDIENLRFNTAISQMMILVNAFEKENKTFGIHNSEFIILLSPFAPHIAEEIWQEVLKNKESIFLQQWPKYDEELIKDQEIELIIQVNGKMRDKIKVSSDISEEEAKKLALESEKIKTQISGKEIKKIIFIKGKLISIVL